MDLHWRVARMRKWVELGEREGLTHREIARRAGISVRTVGRWCRAVRRLQAREAIVRLSELSRDDPEALTPPPRVEEEPPAAERAFIDLFKRPLVQESQIQISLSGDRRRVLIDSAVDVEALVRVIAAVERC